MAAMTSTTIFATGALVGVGVVVPAIIIIRPLP